MRPLPIYIGFDPREAVAYHVCCQSILRYASGPVAFIPLALNTLREYDEKHTDGSNAFIYSRFLVPYLERWGQGNTHAIFLDGDMVVRDDIYKLWALRNPRTGVQVVKHDYKTKYAEKYLGAKNEDYPRKQWSSVVVWNCNFYPNRILTPEFVHQQTGAYLHRFSWLKDEQIGELPSSWNRLVLEQEVEKDDKLLHFTIGIPAFDEYRNCDKSEEWWQTLDCAMSPLKRGSF